MEQKYEQFKGQPRLPKSVVPKRYGIKLKPDLASCTFAGTVEISVDVVAETKFIVLNAADLTVSRDGVRFTSGTKVSPDLCVMLRINAILCLMDSLVVEEEVDFFFFVIRYWRFWRFNCSRRMRSWWWSFPITSRLESGFCALPLKEP